LQKASPKITLLINSVASPLQVGIYEDDTLIGSITKEEKTSEILLPLLMSLIERYDVSNMIYVRGPGSYMAIKLTYVTLKTLEIVRGIPCQGCSGFALNGGKPIKAVGNLYFIKEKETIITKKLEPPVEAAFVLPLSIQDLVIDEESTPDYMLPAV